MSQQVGFEDVVAVEHEEVILQQMLRRLQGVGHAQRLLLPGVADFRFKPFTSAEIILYRLGIGAGNDNQVVDARRP